MGEILLSEIKSEPSPAVRAKARSHRRHAAFLSPQSWGIGIKGRVELVRTAPSPDYSFNLPSNELSRLARSRRGSFFPRLRFSAEPLGLLRVAFLSIMRSRS
jgi:hypothetical protein